MHFTHCIHTELQVIIAFINFFLSLPTFNIQKQNTGFCSLRAVVFGSGTLIKN